MGGLNLYQYVFNPFRWVDPLGLAPTDKWARDTIKEPLGTNARDGGAYIFEVIELMGNPKWYVGKANDLYKRLTDHLRSGKLTNSMLDTINVVINPKGSSAIDHFKLENKIIDAFGGISNLDNKINSPGANC